MAFTDGHVHLDSVEAMFSALAELAGADAQKFRGAVAVWPDAGGATWRLEVNDGAGTCTAATLGDHLVLTYGRLLRLSDDEYRSLT